MTDTAPASMAAAPRRVLVVRLSSLGDVVLTTALFPNLRAAWPGAEITVLTKPAFASVFDHNPSVDHVRLFDPRRQPFSQLASEIKNERFDVIVDLHANLRTWFLRLLAGAPVTVVVDKQAFSRWRLVLLKQKGLGLERSVRERILETLDDLDVPVVSRRTQLFPQAAAAVAETHGLGAAPRLIGVAPGARHATKRWPAERFAEAANRLAAADNATVVLLGDKSDRPAADEVARSLRVPCRNLAGWTSLAELIAIVSRLSLLLTNDSGVLHIGEALDIPTVAMFGPTVRAFGFAPYQPTSRLVEVTSLACRPCSLHGTERCPEGHHRCLLELSPEAAVAAAAEIDAAVRKVVA